MRTVLGGAAEATDQKVRGTPPPVRPAQLQISAPISAQLGNGLGLVVDASEAPDCRIAQPRSRCRGD